MIFGDNYAGKSYCLNNVISTSVFNVSDQMFEDGTTKYELKMERFGDKEINIIDTPGLNSILNHSGFVSFKELWSQIKNKRGLILLCVDCKMSRFANTVRKFRQIVEFFDSKSRKQMKVNLLFNRYKNNEKTNAMIKKFKKGLPMEKSKFYCYCQVDAKEIQTENEPYITQTVAGFKYAPFSQFAKDFKIPIGDLTVVKKSFDGALGKCALQLVWQIQQEIEVPGGAIEFNPKIANLLYKYNFSSEETDKESLRQQIIDEIDHALTFE